jgi:hypothetical protein
MKIATREDIAAPIEVVFAQLADFDGYERGALRRGAEVVRTDDLTVPGIGMAWRAAFDYRGKERKATIELTDYDPPNGMILTTHSNGADIVSVIDLVAMSKTRTRMNVSVDVRPRSLPAKLIVQSLKLARSSVLKRFRKRVTDFAADLENRCKRKMA